MAVLERCSQRILVVDDDPYVAMAVRARLEAEGYEVIVATDGRDALIKVFDERQDLVVLDVLLPYVRGLQVLASIRHDPELRATPVVILSVLSSPQDIARAMWDDPDVYLTKPADSYTYWLHPEELDDLVVVVRRLLSVRPAAAEAACQAVKDIPGRVSV
ncbi:MAG: response regulator [Abditibacteriales bacterium]|nr:response regulator [Abditibacteriales bacterium]MDW8367895.1 response regulator [Abditibacteriales bacterium]